MQKLKQMKAHFICNQNFLLFWLRSGKCNHFCFALVYTFLYKNNVGKRNTFMIVIWLCIWEHREQSTYLQSRLGSQSARRWEQSCACCIGTTRHCDYSDISHAIAFNRTVYSLSTQSASYSRLRRPLAILTPWTSWNHVQKSSTSSYSYPHGDLQTAEFQCIRNIFRRIQFHGRKYILFLFCA